MVTRRELLKCFGGVVIATVMGGIGNHFVRSFEPCVGACATTTDIGQYLLTKKERLWYDRRKEMEAEEAHIMHTPHGIRSSLVNPSIALMNMANLFYSFAKDEFVLSQLSQRVHLVRRTFVVNGLPKGLDGFTLLHMTDPHFDGSAAHFNRLSRALTGVRANLTLLTGDYLFSWANDREEAAILARQSRIAGQIGQLVRPIAPNGKGFSTLGNHDTADLGLMLRAQGIDVLLNQSVVIEHNGCPIRITGTDDTARYFTAAAREVFEQNPIQDEFGLALSHTPEMAEAAAKAGYHLYLDGHTHGGQICASLDGAPLLLPPMYADKAMSRGRWQLEKMQGFTSNGIGVNPPLPFRLNCPAEATLITLKAA